MAKNPFKWLFRHVPKLNFRVRSASSLTLVGNGRPRSMDSGRPPAIVWPEGNFPEKFRPLEETMRSAIATALTGVGVPFGAVIPMTPVLQPDAMTFHLRMATVGFDAAKQKLMRSYLRMQLNADNVAVSRTGGSILVTLRFPRRLGSLSPADIEAGAVGCTPDGKPLRIVFNDGTKPSIKITGSPGAGKSTLVRAILLQLLLERSPQETGLMIADPKKQGDSYGCFAGAPHMVAPIARNIKGVEQTIAAWCKEIETRIAGKPWDYELFLVIDEAQRALKNKDLRKRVAWAVREGRSEGARLVYINQHDDPEDSHRAILRNIVHGCLGRTASAQDGAHLAGQSKVETNKLSGEGAFIYVDGNIKQEFFAVNVKPHHVTEALAKLKPSPVRSVLVDRGRDIERVIERAQVPPPPKVGRPSSALSALTVALDTGFQERYSRGLPARQAARFGIGRPEWNLLQAHKKRLRTASFLGGRVRATLRKMEEDGYINGNGIVTKAGSAYLKENNNGQR